MTKLPAEEVDNGFSYDFFKGGEANLLNRLAPLEPKIVFDVGANVGKWSTLAHIMFPEATIHCFEISKKTFENLKANCTSPNFVLNNFGLSDKAGVFEYKDYGENSGVNSILLRNTFHDFNITPELIKADLYTGFEYCKNNNIDHIDLLKIDVEGAESQVLEGFKDLLDAMAIGVIQFEYGYANGDAHFLMRDFFEFFAKYGYIVTRVRNGPITFSEWKYSDNDFLSGPNYVAVLKDKEIIKALGG